MIDKKMTKNEIIDKQVPLALVKTWIGLVTSKEAEQAVKDRALLMLRDKIGTIEEIAAFAKKHNIN